MNLDATTYQLIENYLADKLGEAERVSFEAEMASNSALAEAVADAQLANEVLLEMNFAQILSDYKASKAPKQSNNNKLFGVLGVIAGAAALSSLFFLPWSKLSDQPKEETVSVEKLQSVEEVVEVETTSPAQKIEMEAPQHMEKPEELHPVLQSEPSNKAQQLITTTELDEAAIVSAPVEEEEPQLLSVSEPIVEEIEESMEPRLVAPAEIPDPCANVQFIAETRAWETCEGESTGRLEILTSTIKGGVGPYSFSLSSTNFQVSPEFLDLGAGQYELLVKDSRGCESSFDLEVAPKVCRKRLEITINPDFGEYWEIEGGQGAGCEVVISNRGGQKVFEHVVDQGEFYQWQGLSNKGQELPSGTYIFRKQCGQQITEGTVVIMR